MNDLTILTLVQKIRDREPDAADELVKRYRPVIMRVIRRRLGRQLRPMCDTEDFAQALWKSIFENAENLATFASDDALASYLCQIAVNKVASAARSNATLKRDVQRQAPLGNENQRQLFAADPTPSEAASGKELWEQLLDGLTPPQRRIAEMRIEGHTVDEIAAALGVNERTVRRALDRMHAKQFPRE